MKVIYVSSSSLKQIIRDMITNEYPPLLKKNLFKLCYYQDFSTSF